MDATTSTTSDPVELVRKLDADAIRTRLADLDREREALMVLLRAAVRARKPVATGEGSRS
jgi:hypothetical protein